MDRDSAACRLGDHNPASFPDPQRSLRALAMKRFFDGQFVGSPGGEQLAHPIRQMQQTLRQQGVATAKTQDAGSQ